MVGDANIDEPEKAFWLLQVWLRRTLKWICCCGGQPLGSPLLSFLLSRVCAECPSAKPLQGSTVHLVTVSSASGAGGISVKENNKILLCLYAFVRQLDRLDFYHSYYHSSEISAVALSPLCPQSSHLKKKISKSLLDLAVHSDYGTTSFSYTVSLSV